MVTLYSWEYLCSCGAVLLVEGDKYKLLVCPICGPRVERKV
jgi:DNA-directed RNA polymerase subunit RPC12/RpoP